MKKTQKIEVIAYCIEITEEKSVFDVQFHDGYRKRFTIYISDCATQRCSERDMLENLVLEYYEETLGKVPQVTIFFS